MHSSDVKAYLGECRQLSVTARHAIALLLFEGFFDRAEIKDSLVSDFLDYLWGYHFGLSDFQAWEANPPPLASYAMSGRMSSEIDAFLARHDLSESGVWRLAHATIGLLVGDFYGAPDDEATLRHLEEVIHASSADVLPPLTPFKFSRFEDGGCGHHLDHRDLMYWRSLDLHNPSCGTWLRRIR